MFYYVYDDKMRKDAHPFGIQNNFRKGFGIQKINIMKQQDCKVTFFLIPKDGTPDEHGNTLKDVQANINTWLTRSELVPGKGFTASDYGTHIMFEIWRKKPPVQTNAPQQAKQPVAKPVPQTDMPF